MGSLGCYKERPRCRKILIRYFQGLSDKEKAKKLIEAHFSQGLEKQMMKMIGEGYWEKDKIEQFYCEGYGEWVDGCPDNFIYLAERRTKPFGDICLARAGWCQLSKEQLRKNRGRIRYITFCDLGIGIDNLMLLWAASNNCRTVVGRGIRRWIDENFEEILEIAEKPKNFPFASVTSKKEY